MNLPILEFLFQCYFLYKRHTHFSTLSVYTVIFNPIIITWYTLYTTINCTPFYLYLYIFFYSIFISIYFYLYICILYLHLYIFIYIFSFLIVSIIFCFLIWTIEYFIIPRSSIITTTTAITIACNGKTYLNCDSPAAIYMT